MFDCVWFLKLFYKTVFQNQFLDGKLNRKAKQLVDVLDFFILKTVLRNYSSNVFLI